MKQFEILYGGLIPLGHIIAANKEAAIAKYRELNPYMEGCLIVAKYISD